MKIPKLVLISYDGTLFNCLTANAICIIKTFTTLTDSPCKVSVMEIAEAVRDGLGLEDIFKALVREHGITSVLDVTMSDWKLLYHRLFRTEGLQHVQTSLDAFNLLLRLKAAEIPVLVTGSGDFSARPHGWKVLERFHLSSVVDSLMHIYDFSNVLRLHHDVENWYKRAENGRKRWMNSEMLVVSNKPGEMGFAEKFGAMRCWVNCGIDAPEELSLRPDEVVDSLEEVQGFVDGSRWGWVDGVDPNATPTPP